LIGAVGKTAFKVELERDRAALHAPRAVFELRGEQELDTAPVGWGGADTQRRFQCLILQFLEYGNLILDLER
jgi:hypothetical protein